MARRNLDDDDVTGAVNVMDDREDGYVPDIEGVEPGDDEEIEDDDESVETAADDDDLDPDEDDQDDADDDEDSETDEDGPEPLEAPANWPEQEKAFFNALPPQLQHAYAQRAQYMQADYTRKTQQLAQVRQNYMDLERVTQPHEQKWALNGMNKAQAIHQLIALSDFATDKPQEFIKYFANLRGVNLAQLAAPQSQQEEYVDPQVAALQKQIAAVTAQVNQANQYQQQQVVAQRQQQYYQAYQATNDGIENFANQTGPDGRKLYPYFNALEEDMAALIESKRVSSLHEAYERAVWSNPSTRSKMLQRARSQENAQARQRVERARRASSSLSGGGAPSNGYAPATDDMNTRDLLEAAFQGVI